MYDTSKPSYSGQKPGRFVGKSTEVKPMDVVEGTTFYEGDTTKEWMFIDGEWKFQFQMREVQ